MFSSTKTVTSTSSFSERLADLQRLIADADYVLIGAGAGLTTAAGIDYAGEDFRREFREWIDRYGITDLYSAGFYPFETDEERWAMWAKHIWFSRYRTGALPLYKKLLKMVDGKDYFVMLTVSSKWLDLIHIASLLRRATIAISSQHQVRPRNCITTANGWNGLCQPSKTAAFPRN